MITFRTAGFIVIAIGAIFLYLIIKASIEEAREHKKNPKRWDKNLKTT